MSGLATTAGFFQFRLMSSHSPHPSAAAVSFRMKPRTGDRGQFLSLATGGFLTPWLVEVEVRLTVM
jgi:hypothetical protein